jgi:hypothetical protein
LRTSMQPIHGSLALIIYAPCLLVPRFARLVEPGRNSNLIGLVCCSTRGFPDSSETKADKYPESLTRKPDSHSTMVESARSQSYFPMAMDSQYSEMFCPVDNVSPYAQADYSRLPFYNDSILYDSNYKPANFPSMPATPPSISASHSDPQIPTGYAASGPSIASAPSSAIGSPYSGHQAFQDQWVSTGHGLGLPAAVMDHYFSNEYPGAPEIDGLHHEKLTLPYTTVGTCSIAIH